MIRKLFAFGLAIVLALMPVQVFGKTVSVTNVSYDPTREMFEPVSYTHLDVYKRQAAVCAVVITSFVFLIFGDNLFLPLVRPV